MDTIPAKQTIIFRLDSSGSILDSLILNFAVAGFMPDNSGNFVIYGNYADSFSYQGTTIYSKGGQYNYFLLKISPAGALMFLKRIGTVLSEDPIGSIAIDSSGKIYLSKTVNNTIFIDNDSIQKDTNFFEIAIIVFDPDGALYTYKKVIMFVGSCYCEFKAGGIFLRKKGQLFLTSKYSYWEESDEVIKQFNSNLDSIDTYPGIFVDDQAEHSYFVSNPMSHYWWQPVLKKYRLADKFVLWEKEIGDDYGPFLLDPFYLPGNVILTYGRVGNSYFNDPGSATIEDTTLFFTGPDEMLLALIDSNSHFYFIRHEKIPDARYIKVLYNDNGYAYLLSYWNTDTTYTMGTTFTTTSNNHWVISKLKYLDVSTGIPLKEPKTQITLFPNPTTGKFYVHFGTQVAEGIISVYNITGNCIIKERITNSFDQWIDLRNKGQGIYFIEIASSSEENEVKKEMRKIIIQ